MRDALDLRPRADRLERQRSGAQSASLYSLRRRPENRRRDAMSSTPTPRTTARTPRSPFPRGPLPWRRAAPRRTVEPTIDGQAVAGAGGDRPCSRPPASRHRHATCAIWRSMTPVNVWPNLRGGGRRVAHPVPRLLAPGRAGMGVKGPTSESVAHEPTDVARVLASFVDLFDRAAGPGVHGAYGRETRAFRPAGAARAGRRARTRRARDS